MCFVLREVSVSDAGNSAPVVWWLAPANQQTTTFGTLSCKGGCRARKAGKDSTENNFRDCYNHLWDSSRPNIVTMEREIWPKKSKVLIASEIEALVETLFLEE